MDPATIIAALIGGIFLLGGAVIQGTFAFLGNKKSNGIEVNKEDAGKAGKKGKKFSESVMEVKSLEELEEKVKELKREGKEIWAREDEAVDSYGRHVLELVLLHGIASIHLQLSYPHGSLWVSVMMTIVFFFAFGVASTTALTKLEVTFQSTGCLRKRQKKLQKQVKAFKDSAGEAGSELSKRVARLEKAIAKAISKSKDKEANSTALPPVARWAFAYGLCFPVLLRLALSSASALPPLARWAFAFGLCPVLVRLAL